METSDFVCNRTVAIMSDYSAIQLPRQLIEYLKNEEKMVVTLTAELT